VKRWPDVRAGLIALAILFALVDGCPLPPQDKTPAWEQGFVEPLRAAQHVVMTPMAWVRPHLRVAQRWALYQAPSTERYRLWIEGQDMQGRWQILYRASDPAHTDDAAFIDASRVRGAYDPTDVTPGQYPVFARYVTQRVLDRHPDLVAARIRLEKVHITADGFTPTGQFVQPHMRLRGGPP
jgi:hypothetical protein